MKIQATDFIAVTELASGPVLECPLCGALVRDSDVHAEWHLDPSRSWPLRKHAPAPTDKQEEPDGKA